MREREDPPLIVVILTIISGGELIWVWADQGWTTPTIAIAFIFLFVTFGNWLMYMRK